APDIEELGKNYGTVNADFLYEGPMTARRALVRSRNIPALYTFELVGQDNFLDTTTKLGIESFNERKHLGELLTLGVGETTLLENTAAYSVFAAEGQKAPVNPILKIEDSNGEVIYESRDVKKEQAFPKEDIYMINWTLCGLGGHEDRFREQAPDYIYQVDGKNALCAKTGTSDGPRDLYTMMYHKNLAVGVWIGNNNNTFMPGGWSFNTALPLARSIMDVTKDKYKPELFAKPENIKETIVCTETGMIPTPADQPCPSEKAIFIEGHAPMQDGRHIIYVCKANRLLPSTLPLEHQPLVDAGYIEGKIAVNAFLDLPKYQPLYEQALKRYYPKYTTKIPGIGECNIPADQLEGGGNTTTLPTEIDTSIRMYSPLFDLDSLRLPRSELSNTNMNIEINAPREVTEIRFYVEKAGETNDTLVETGPLLERDPGTNKTRYNFNFGVFDSYPAGDYNLFIDLFGSGEASIEVHMLPFSIL
ncbi:hypothetical protein KC660_00750, partial [Candidatus Dojkabacteria bacterium]|nr:hypothetical protein [Candidatus Dojkabacteria bacterium]